jgi:hypothetical protein
MALTEQSRSCSAVQCSASNNSLSSDLVYAWYRAWHVCHGCFGTHLAKSRPIFRLQVRGYGLAG